jgi:hypothetical protein
MAGRIPGMSGPLVVLAGRSLETPGLDQRFQLWCSEWGWLLAGGGPRGLCGREANGLALATSKQSRRKFSTQTTLPLPNVVDVATTVPERVDSVTTIKVKIWPILNLGSSNVRRESGEKRQLRGAMSAVFQLHVTARRFGTMDECDPHPDGRLARSFPSHPGPHSGHISPLFPLWPTVSNTRRLSRILYTTQCASLNDSLGTSPDVLTHLWPVSPEPSTSWLIGINGAKYVPNRGKLRKK